MYYITTENIITPNQYGFMPGSTTVDCLIDLVEEISTTLDRGDYSVTILLDLIIKPLMLLTIQYYYLS